MHKRDDRLLTPQDARGGESRQRGCARPTGAPRASRPAAQTLPHPAAQSHRPTATPYARDTTKNNHIMNHIFRASYAACACFVVCSVHAEPVRQMRASSPRGRVPARPRGRYCGGPAPCAACSVGGSVTRGDDRCRTRSLRACTVSLSGSGLLVEPRLRNGVSHACTPSDRLSQDR